MINDASTIEWLATGLATDSGEEIVGLSHTDYMTARELAARAERAEAAYNEWHDKALRYLAGMREAMEHNAALRAELDALTAAHAWRPVTEAPTNGEYLTYVGGVYDLCMYTANLDEPWWNGAYGRTPTHWQPLPPAPDADEEARS